MGSIRIINDGLGFILFSFSFLFFLYFYFPFLYFELRQKMWCDIKCDTYHKVITYVTVMVTWSYDIEKNVEGSRIDNVI